MTTYHSLTVLDRGRGFQEAKAMLRRHVPEESREILFAALDGAVWTYLHGCEHVELASPNASWPYPTLVDCENDFLHFHLAFGDAVTATLTLTCVERCGEHMVHAVDWRITSADWIVNYLRRHCFDRDVKERRTLYRADCGSGFFQVVAAGIERWCAKTSAVALSVDILELVP